MPKNKLSRLRVLSLVFLLVGGIFAVKLFFLQLVNGEEYRAKADGQYAKPRGETFTRGTIYFTARPTSGESAGNRRVSAAALKDEYTLVINPAKLGDHDETYDALTAITPIGYADFSLRAEKVGDPHEEIATRLSAETAAAVRALKLPGVELIEEKARFYPGGTLAAHLLGFVGYDEGAPGELSGRYGLEKYYDAVLTRQDGPRFSSLLHQIFLGESETSSGNEEAGDIVTTIEPTVERSLEDELSTISELWRPAVTGGIIMDPRTGEIIAMGALPNFDPGGKKFNIEHLTNPLVERVYEMGSIMKPLTMSAGLDAKVVTPETTYYDRGSVILGDREIWNYDRRGRGVVSMQEVLNQSLNTGAIYVMQQLGKDRLKKYFQDFGLLSEKTGIDLPGELNGLSGNLDNGREVEYATASFGQGIAVTPIAVTAALSALANGGRLMRPFVVREIDYEEKATVETKPLMRRQAVSEAAASTTTKMLVQVVDKSILSGRERLAHYQVAAKTGTAQIRNPAGGYYTDRYLHSFFGYFPASNPRFSVFLYTVEPQGAQYASETLAKPFFNLAKFLLNYYQIPPDR